MPKLLTDFKKYVSTFVTVAAAMFFFVVAPIAALMERRAKEDPDTEEYPACTSAIPVRAKTCRLWTSEPVVDLG